MQGWAWDLRHALRLQRATPVSSAMAVLVLAAAFAFVCVFLSLWSELALKPHRGFEASGTLVSIGQHKGDRVMPVNLDFIDDVRERVLGLEAVAGVMAMSHEVAGEEESRFIATELVTRDYVPGLRPRLALGRGFDAADHEAQAERVAILSHDYWQREYGGSADVIGRELLIGGPGWRGTASSPGDASAYRIIGVMAAELRGTHGEGTEAWMPFERAVHDMFPGMPGHIGRMATLFPVGRLASGAEIEAIRDDLQRRYPEEVASRFGLRADYVLDAVSGVVRDIGAHRDALRHIRLALASMLLVMVVAACNLSLFLLAQAPRRRKELGIRRAVGAPMRRIARQLATECLVLTGVAALLGVLLGFWLTGVVGSLAVFQQVRLEAASPLDWRVMSAGIAGMLLLALVVSLAPIAMARSAGIAASSRDDGGTGARWQRLAGAAQVAVATVLACVAVAIGWHVYQLATMDRGFDDSDILVVDVAGSTFASEAGWEGLASTRAYRRRLLESIPGIERVGFGSPLPGQRITFATAVPSQQGEPRPVRAVVVSADSVLPEILGLRLTHGRFPGPDQPQSVLVNASMAMEVWGRLDVAGEVFELPALRSVTTDGDVTVTVSGVVADATFVHPALPAEPMVFTPLSPSAEMDSVVLETRLGIAELRETLQLNVEHGGLDLRVNGIRRLSDIWHDLMAADRARTLVAVMSALLVLVLSVIGFYGTLLYLVAAGRREYAVRSAMGAGPRLIRRLVVGRGLRIAAPGIVVGAVGGLAAVGALRGTLVSESTRPVAVVLVVIALLALVVIVTSALPARRAARVLPAQALREEG